MEVSVHASMRGYMWKLLPTTDALRNRSLRHGNGKTELMASGERRPHGSIGSLLLTKAPLQMRNSVLILDAVGARLSCCVADPRELTKRRLLPSRSDHHSDAVK
jgi:hypothetical protein